MIFTARTNNGVWVYVCFVLCWLKCAVASWGKCVDPGMLVKVWFTLLGHVFGCFWVGLIWSILIKVWFLLLGQIMVCECMCVSCCVDWGVLLLIGGSVLMRVCWLRCDFYCSNTRGCVSVLVCAVRLVLITICCYSMGSACWWLYVCEGVIFTAMEKDCVCILFRVVLVSLLLGWCYLKYSD